MKTELQKNKTFVEKNCFLEAPAARRGPRKSSRLTLHSGPSYSPTKLLKAHLLHQAIEQGRTAGAVGTGRRVKTRSGRRAARDVEALCLGADPTNGGGKRLASKVGVNIICCPQSRSRLVACRLLRADGGDGLRQQVKATTKGGDSAAGVFKAARELQAKHLQALVLAGILLHPTGLAGLWRGLSSWGGWRRQAGDEVEGKGGCVGTARRPLVVQQGFIASFKIIPGSAPQRFGQGPLSKVSPMRLHTAQSSQPRYVSQYCDDGQCVCEAQGP